jgi:hypothetical protein
VAGLGCASPSMLWNKSVTFDAIEYRDMRKPWTMRGFRLIVATAG